MSFDPTVDEKNLEDMGVITIIGVSDWTKPRKNAPKRQTGMIEKFI